MKIVFFAGIPKRNINDLSVNDINGTAALYSYFLRKEFHKIGIETDYCEAHSEKSDPSQLNKIEVPSGDHIISVAQRGFTSRCKILPSLYDKVKRSIKGKITSICDKSTKDPVEDIIFYAMNDSNRMTKNIYVGTAIDPTILYPEQDSGCIRILIDHAYYGFGKNDKSKQISEQCLEFQKNYKHKKVIIRRFSGPTGIEDVTFNNSDPGIYKRQTSLSYPIACQEYRKCHIFFVTHQESLGLSASECSACGSYIVSPTNYIKPAVLKQFRHRYFNDVIPWSKIIKSLNIDESVQKTSKLRWSTIASKIIESLES